VLHLTLSSKLLGMYPVDLVWILLRKAFIYINGLRVCNPYTQLYVGDVMYINTYVSGVLALAHNQLSLRPHLSRGFSQIQTHPKAFKVNFSADSASYLEVDELTSTVALLTEPTTWGSVSRHLASQFPHITFRMYN